MKPDVKVLLLGLAALTIYLLYFLFPLTIGEGDFEIRKADFLSLTIPVAPVIVDSTALSLADTMALKVEEKTPLVLDTLHHKILFFGDSMVDYLGRPFASYAEKNGHQIESVVWFSSTTQHWAQTDTLQYFLKKYEPDYIVICLGSNEIFSKNTDDRRQWVNEIQAKLEGLPYIWISPPNWKPVYKFTDMLRETVGDDRFFDSTHLEMARGSDHAHPTYDSAIGWMDTVACWMRSSASRYPIRMDKPEKKAKNNHLHVLKPYNLP